MTPNLSDYDKALASLKQRQCEICKGSGKCDDAEPGDIYYNEWVCKTCNGSGFKPQ